MSGDGDKAVSVTETGDADAAAWDAFVLSAPAGTFFHLFGWKPVIEAAFGHKCYFLCARRDGEIAGVLPLTHVKSMLFGNSLISTGFTVGGGPVAADAAATAALDRAAVALADRLDVDCIEYRTEKPSRDGWAHKDGLYAMFRRPIGPDPEADMLAIPRKQRAMVRKGIKAGLVSRIDADAARLHRIYSISVRNLGTPVFTRKFFDLLLKQFGDRVDIVTIEHEGNAIASVMNFYFRDQVLPYFGGGTFEARPLAGNDFMYWEVMRRAVEKGCRVFDFGRSKIGTGAFSFKKNWGFDPEPVAYEYYLRKIDAIPEINPLNPKYRFFINCWKKLPLPVSRFIGPMISRNLG